MKITWVMADGDDGSTYTVSFIAEEDWVCIKVESRHFRVRYDLEPSEALIISTYEPPYFSFIVEEDRVINGFLTLLKARLKEGILLKEVREDGDGGADKGGGEEA